MVKLTDDERSSFRELVRKGTASARKLTRAHILLQADDRATDQAMAAALHVGQTTVERGSNRFIEGTLEGALTDAKRPGGTRKRDRKQEAPLLATACSRPAESALARPCNSLPISSSAEHQALWPRMAEIWPDYNNYQKKTDRQIPLVILERI